jgi:hypothetical protein
MAIQLQRQLEAERFRAMATIQNSPRRCAFLVAMVITGLTPLQAQAPVDRGWLHVNGVYQMTKFTFTDTITFTQNVEDGTTVTPYTTGSVPGVDVMGGVRLWQYLGVGAGVTIQATQIGVSTTSTTRVPHPFYFDRHRTTTGPTPTDRKETQINLYGMAVIPAGRRVRVTLFGGPTFFRVQQELVTAVTTTDAYPFNDVTFQNYAKRQHDVSTVGFNVGGDVSMFFFEHIGVGGMARYSIGSLAYPTADGNTLTTDTGGFHVGGGLRVKF